MLDEEGQKRIDGWCEKYNGYLSIEKLAEGISACITNATELYEDGLILLEQKRYARPLSLFVAAMEEIGKISVLCSMARIPKENQALWRECWRDFRSHQNKATRAFVLTYAEEAKQYPELIIAASMLQYQLSPLAERIRQVGFYVDYHAQEKRWVSPAEVGQYDVDLWLNRLEPSLAQVQYLFDLGLCSARALEIQRETLGPINVARPKRKDLTQTDLVELQAKAIKGHKEFYRQLVAEGILSTEISFEVMGMPLKEFISD